MACHFFNAKLATLKEQRAGVRQEKRSLCGRLPSLLRVAGLAVRFLTGGSSSDFAQAIHHSLFTDSRITNIE
jgi:hypothetical protein